jgi:hypothetical protein
MLDYHNLSILGDLVMTTTKRILSTLMLAAALGTTANAGIIVNDRSGVSSSSEPCSGKSVAGSVFNSLMGIIVNDFAGIIVNDFASAACGIIVNDRTASATSSDGIIVNDRACDGIIVNDRTCGIIVND